MKRDVNLCHFDHTGCPVTLHLLKSHQQATLFCVVAAQPSACMDRNIHLREFRLNPILQPPRSSFILAMGNPHLATSQSRILQIVQQRGNRFRLTPAFIG